MCYLELENESESSSITGNFVASRIVMLRYDVRQAMLLGSWNTKFSGVKNNSDQKSQTQ